MLSIPSYEKKEKKQNQEQSNPALFVVCGVFWKEGVVHSIMCLEK
jgi:hypothetical protein